MISKAQYSKPSLQSILGLTALVIFMSNVRDGVGPLLSIYLKSVLNWNTELTGMALASYFLVVYAGNKRVRSDYNRNEASFFSFIRILSTPLFARSRLRSISPTSPVE
jgi:hypothetical protein